MQPAHREEEGISGQVIATDGPFGNLITNVSGDEFGKLGYAHGDVVHVTVNGKPMQIPFVKTFGDVPMGKPLIYVDSRGRFSIALNQDNFAKKFDIHPPVALFISKK